MTSSWVFSTIGVRKPSRLSARISFRRRQVLQTRMARGSPRTAAFYPTVGLCILALQHVGATDEGHGCGVHAELELHHRAPAVI